MKRLYFTWLPFNLLFLVGCSTSPLKNIERSEKSLGVAKRLFAKVDYARLNERIDPPARITNLGPVLLYDAADELFGSQQISWFYYQRVERADGLPCFGFIMILKDGQDELTPINKASSFNCFGAEKKPQSIDLF